MVVKPCKVAARDPQVQSFGTDLSSIIDSDRSTLVDLRPRHRVETGSRPGLLQGAGLSIWATALLEQLPRQTHHRRRTVKLSSPAFRNDDRPFDAANPCDTSENDSWGQGEPGVAAGAPVVSRECQAEWGAFLGRDLSVEEALLAELARVRLPREVAFPAGQSSVTCRKWAAAAGNRDAGANNREPVLGLIDTTLFGTATHGVALTTAGLIWRERFGAPQFLLYRAIRPNAVRSVGRTIHLDASHRIRLGRTAGMDPPDLARFVQLASAFTILAGRQRDDRASISALSVLGSALAHGELAGALARAARELTTTSHRSMCCPEHFESGFAAQFGFDWLYSC